MRKTQQLHCYAAEAGLDTGPTFRDVAEVQRFVDDLRETPWWHLQGYSLHVLRIEVGLRGKGKEFDGLGWFEPDTNAGRIELKPTALRTRLVLHEVAHVLASAVYGSKAHDPAWALTYLTIVSCVMGPDAYLQLQRSFDAHGVDYDAPARRGTGIAL